MTAAGYRGWTAMGYSLVIGAAGLIINFVLAFMAFRMVLRLNQPLMGVDALDQPKPAAEPKPEAQPAQA